MSRFRRLTSLFYASNNLKQAVGILFVTVLVSNVLGLARNVIIANRVGVTYGTFGPLDNYYAAFLLPDLIYMIVIVGALSSAVLPLLVKLDTESEEKFWQTFNILLSTGFTAIVFAMVLLYILIPTIVPHLLPGFTHADRSITVSLGRVLLLSPLFFTISQITSSALQAKRYFLASALAPIIYNLAIISGALLIPRYGMPVLVSGVILGACGHFLVQLPTLIRLGWRFQFQLKVLNEHVRQVIRLMIPRAIALTGNQLLLIGFYSLASNFREGSIAIYKLNDDLQTAPVLLLANTLAMAILPDFARHIAKGNESEFRELVGKAIRLILFIFLPVTVFLLLFAPEVTNLYISVGHSISAADISIAVNTFRAFVVSLFFQAAILLLARGYFARGETKRPTMYSLVSIAIAWIMAYTMRNSNFGVSGLALAFSVASTINAMLLWFSLKLPFSIILKDSENRLNLLPILLGTGVFTVILVILRRILPYVSSQFTDGPSARTLTELILATVVGGVFYIVWSRVFNLEQWKLVKPTKHSTES